MLNVHYFTFNAFEENTYVISNDEQQCWIVDPGMNSDAEIGVMNQFIQDRHLKPQAVINTHAHLDHIFGVQATMDKYHIPFGVHEKEMPVLQMASASAAMFGFHLPTVPIPTFFIKEGEPLALGSDELQVFLTPGHSPGSLSFYYPRGNWVISGDVLFSGSIGRTDLPGGSYDVLINSIRTHLLTLPGSTTVHSGHGPSTTIQEEQAHNPFLK